MFAIILFNKEIVMAKCTKEQSCPNTVASRGLVELHGFGGKGLQHVMTMNTAGKKKYIGIRYKTNYRDKGTMLNFCPWCGANIQFWV